MKNKTQRNTKIALLVLVSGALMFFSNLFWLSQYERPTLRGNHVGLTFLTLIVFLGLVFIVNWFFWGTRNRR